MIMLRLREQSLPVAEILLAEGHIFFTAESQSIVTEALTENGKLLLRPPEEANMSRQLLF